MMKTMVAALAFGALMMVSGSAMAQKTSSAERGLLGINLYDSGQKVLQRYGSPDQILAVNVGGGTTTGGAPGFGGPSGGSFGGPGMGGPSGAPTRGGGGGGGSPSTATTDMRSPFAFEDTILQAGMAGAPKGGRMPPGISGVPGAPSGSSPSGSGMPGMPGGMPGAPGGSSTPGRGFGGAAAQAATFTRWVYNRNNTRYGFVLDKFNRVVQIEAIGIKNPTVKTRRGLGFGATFAQVLKTYKTPDGYDIAGDNITVKFLNRAKVAFKLSRLGDKKPQVVTGIVVAAAKS